MFVWVIFNDIQKWLLGSLKQTSTNVSLRDPWNFVNILMEIKICCGINTLQILLKCFFIFLGYLKMLSGLHTQEYMFWNYLLCFEGLFIMCKNVHSFEGLPCYNGVGNAYIHLVKCCKCNTMKFQCLKACQFRKVYMYEYFCGECIHWVKWVKCVSVTWWSLSVWRLASSGKYICTSTAMGNAYTG